MKRLLLLLFLCAVTACTPSSATLWIAEDESGAANIISRGDSIEIIAPQGLTLWYKEPLQGNYRISYTARMIIRDGAHDRLADLNCFWAAGDPLHPQDLFARAAWRNGIFRHYNSLNLFYVGYGGNDNTTTRFRKYHGDRFGAPDTEVKPLLGEYTDPKHLLTPNRDYHIQIEVCGDTTRYVVDGEEIFAHPLTEGEGDGYFALRLLTNHTLISGFKVERI